MLYTKPLRIVAGLLTIGSLLTLNACRDVQDPLGAQQKPSAGSGRLSADFMFYALKDNNELLLINSQRLPENGYLSLFSIMGNMAMYKADSLFRVSFS